MRLLLALVFVLAALALTEARKCNACNRNECDCQREIARGPDPQPFPFFKKKKCNVTKPLELKPKPDVCSCEQEFRIRPSACDHVEPKFAKSRSCECGFENHEQPVRKYPADLISRQLAMEYASKKNIPETDLLVYGRPVKPPPPPKQEALREERLFKTNLHVLELKPPKRKRVHYRVYSSEETEGAPCNPKEESYGDICYGKVEFKEPKFEVLRQDAPVCDECTDDQSTEEEVDTTREEQDSPEKKPKKHCSKCLKPKKKCGCLGTYDSYERYDDSDEYEYPLNKCGRSARSSDDPEPSLVV
ncbi:uncharacterized protein LOC128269788 [Anopheles cruzii]|uniref:uncharacterized protein LOC128269788 n=1 Tax=Anopheles cruzii TaxID=68878 RepID=UPI0022EC1E17|nr:uncharacterized protein LOC128269788 [Anopheles cruzii]